MALAFLAFGLWLRLARQGRFRLRAILFVPISFVIFFAHTFGWGTLGLLAFSAEAVRQHDGGRGWFRSGINAALHASVMALPIIIVLWRGVAKRAGGDDARLVLLEAEVGMDLLGRPRPLALVRHCDRRDHSSVGPVRRLASRQLAFLA